ncbi:MULTISPECIES: hypothetical protein [Pseudomonas]|uniref:hypothetical protein n=1 Tax=Pseudomonas TaxID=286 RepID=UPI000A4AEEEC|nr:MULTISPECIES: hypothetical protein [Pseudomonas]MEB6591072.1 hypothetical protein [Pseudomonas asiatica]
MLKRGWSSSAASLCLLLVLWGPQAQALEATVTAQYRAQASGRFENTTPLASYCRRWPAECTGIPAMQIPISYSRTTVTAAPDVRDRFYIQLPGPRQVDVFHETTGENHSLRFELTAVSQQVTGGDHYRNNPAYTAYARGGCQYRKTFSYNRMPAITWYLWTLRTPQAPTGCHSDPEVGNAGQVIDIDVSEMGVAYNLDMPAPYRMKPGIYTGSVSYTIGPGGDFDFGNNVRNLNGDSLTLNFRLDVQHAFIFDFPPGSERAVLEPPGGWQAWLGGRGAPQRLNRDLPFRLWSTGPFKVYKLCRYNLASGCGIRNDAGHQVPVEIALSLPGGIQHAGGAVQKLPLPTGRGNALAFDSVTPVLNRPGQLHFEVAGPDVRTMLAHPGSRYEGEVTVVFDAQL